MHQVCTRCSLFGCAPCDHCSPGVHQVCTRCALGCAPGVHQVCRAKYRYHRSLAGGILYCTHARVQYIISPRGASPRHGRRYSRIARRAPKARELYDFTACMHEDDIVYIHQRAQRAGIALKTKYSPLVDILPNCHTHLCKSLCETTLAKDLVQMHT